MGRKKKETKEPLPWYLDPANDYSDDDEEEEEDDEEEDDEEECGIGYQSPADLDPEQWYLYVDYDIFDCCTGCDEADIPYCRDDCEKWHAEKNA